MRSNEVNCREELFSRLRHAELLVPAACEMFEDEEL